MSQFVRFLALTFLFGAVAGCASPFAPTARPTITLESVRYVPPNSRSWKGEA